MGHCNLTIIKIAEIPGTVRPWSDCHRSCLYLGAFFMEGSMEEKQETSGKGNGVEEKGTPFLQVLVDNPILCKRMTELTKQGIDPTEIMELGLKHMGDPAGQGEAGNGEQVIQETDYLTLTDETESALEFVGSVVDLIIDSMENLNKYSQRMKIFIDSTALLFEMDSKLKSAREKVSVMFKIVRDGGGIHNSLRSPEAGNGGAS